MTDTIQVSRLVVEVLSPMTYCECYTGPEPTPPEEKLLAGTVKVRTVVVGKLSFTPDLSGSVSAGRTHVNGKLSVTHDWALFSNG